MAKNIIIYVAMLFIIAQFHFILMVHSSNQYLEEKIVGLKKEASHSNVIHLTRGDNRNLIHITSDPDYKSRGPCLFWTFRNFLIRVLAMDSSILINVNIDDTGKDSLLKFTNHGSFLSDFNVRYDDRINKGNALTVDK